MVKGNKNKDNIIRMMEKEKINKNNLILIKIHKIYKIILMKELNVKIIYQWKY